MLDLYDVRLEDGMHTYRTNIESLVGFRRVNLVLIILLSPKSKDIDKGGVFSNQLSQKSRYSL